MVRRVERRGREQALTQLMGAVALWQTNVGAHKHAWGTGASPVLFENLVIVNAAMESDTRFARRKLNGSVAWSGKGMARAWNTPALVATYGERPELVIAISGRLRAFDLRRGRDTFSNESLPPFDHILKLVT